VGHPEVGGVRVRRVNESFRADLDWGQMESKGLSKKEQAWRKRRRAESLRMSLREFWQQAQKKDYRLTMAEWEHAVRERRKVQ
jgi:hypothetical protein